MDFDLGGFPPPPPTLLLESWNQRSYIGETQVECLEEQRENPPKKIVFLGRLPKQWLGWGIPDWSIKKYGRGAHFILQGNWSVGRRGVVSEVLALWGWWSSVGGLQMVLTHWRCSGHHHSPTEDPPPPKVKPTPRRLVEE